MTAVARDRRDQKYRTTCRQLIGQRNGKRLLRQLGVDRFGQRVVVILFFLNARRFQPQLVKFVPSLFVCVSANYRKHRRTQIRRERRWICEIFWKTFATARGDLWIIQISQSADQAGPQISRGGRFTLCRFPAQRLKRWTQKPSGVALKFFALRTRSEER